MSRTARLFLAACAACLVCRAEPTHFRKQHTLLIKARRGNEITLVLNAIRASVGYPDALAYRIYGPDGGSAAQGRLEPGETTTLTLKPAADGLYVLDGNPGMNAFSVDVRDAAWAVDISAGRTLNVINHACPLHFYVPAGLRELALVFSGEAADMKLFRPDGVATASRRLPQYEKVTVATPVGPDQHGWWRLELKLSEDQSIQFPAGIPPTISGSPLSDDMLREVSDGLALVDFDKRPTPHGQLIGTHGNDTWKVGTRDGLELRFTETGKLIDVVHEDVRLADEKAPQLLGFFVRDVAADGDLIVAQCKATQTEAELRIAYNVPGADLTLDVMYAPAPDHIAVAVDVRNQTTRDRAVTVYFALPFPLGDVVWWDDIVKTRPAVDNATYGAFERVSAGANGHHSAYPFGCVTGGEQGLALAIPMDYPLCHRIAACPARRQFFLAVDLGLTGATSKSPNRARFSFVIARCDARWGLRSAAERYYRLFPRFFEKRMPTDGGWVCWGTCEGMTNLDELGFVYHWGPGGAKAVAFDNANGLYSFIYNDSARYFADLGEFDHRPKPDEAAAAMHRLLDAADPRTHVLSVRSEATGRQRYEGREKLMGREAAEEWLKDSVAAVKTSAALDANGHIQVGYLVNRKGWGGEDWWTGRCFCNIDPDIPGGYGAFLLERIMAITVGDYRSQHAEPDGFGLDNYFTNARSLDFSLAHLAYTDFPAAFATGDFRPVIIGDTIMYEWVRELKRRLAAEGKWLMANTGNQPFPFAQHLLDMNGLEWGLERTAPAARTLAYRKQVVALPVKPEHYEEPFIKAHLPMGVIPGGYARGKPFSPGSPTATLYAKYVPIIRRMCAAGWEPVPWATSDAPDVSIERFGTGLPLLFSVHNRGEDAREVGVAIEIAALGPGSARSARDLVDGRDLSAVTRDGVLAFTLSLASSDATVIEVR